MKYTLILITMFCACTTAPRHLTTEECVKAAFDEVGKYEKPPTDKESLAFIQIGLADACAKNNNDPLKAIAVAVGDDKNQ